MSIDGYGRVRAIEGCGLEEKTCCMQQIRCTTSTWHATFLDQGNGLQDLLRHDELTAAAFTPVCYMQHRNHATIPLHATLIFFPAIDQWHYPPRLKFSLYRHNMELVSSFAFPAQILIIPAVCLIVIPRLTLRSPVLTGVRWLTILKKNQGMLDGFWKRETSHMENGWR